MLKRLFPKKKQNVKTIAQRKKKLRRLYSFFLPKKRLYSEIHNILLELKEVSYYFIQMLLDKLFIVFMPMVLYIYT